VDSFRQATNQFALILISQVLFEGHGCPVPAKLSRPEVFIVAPLQSLLQPGDDPVCIDPLPGYSNISLCPWHVSSPHFLYCLMQLIEVQVDDQPAVLAVPVLQFPHLSHEVIDVLAGGHGQIALGIASHL